VPQKIGIQCKIAQSTCCFHKCVFNTAAHLHLKLHKIVYPGTKAAYNFIFYIEYNFCAASKLYTIKQIATYLGGPSTRSASPCTRWSAPRGTTRARWENPSPSHLVICLMTTSCLSVGLSASLLSPPIWCLLYNFWHAQYVLISWMESFSHLSE
jgi:hypothetical protein